MKKNSTGRADIVVVGAGAAGLFAALLAAEEGAQVTIISASPLAQTASYWAQGGAAAALGTNDNPFLHLEDTIQAGRGLVKTAAAEILCKEAPEMIVKLKDFGVIFDQDQSGKLSLSLEGGHRQRRVVHAGGSTTGRRLIRHLAAKAVTHKNIVVKEQQPVTQLLSDGNRCFGVQLDDGNRITANATLLATGGYAAAWSRTTNPPGSTGTGLILAHAAGATLADLEFMQFHPTAVIGIQGREGFLITEAIRGEGATLQTEPGERFVDELAPRDTVTQVICRTLQDQNKSAVWLDMRHIDLGAFPNIVSSLREANLDPATERIPVAPAAHYSIGGVATDLNGESTVHGLFAIGETACTGLHGANRLASNSLSECFVFGNRAVQHILNRVPTAEKTPEVSFSQPADLPTLDRSVLWQHAGPVRNGEELAKLIANEHPLIRWVAKSATERKESRGVHQRSDYPELNRAFDQQHSKLDSTENVALGPT